jgi:hypothetical protein
MLVNVLAVVPQKKIVVAFAEAPGTAVRMYNYFSAARNSVIPSEAVLFAPFAASEP